MTRWLCVGRAVAAGVVVGMAESIVSAVVPGTGRGESARSPVAGGVSPRAFPLAEVPESAGVSSWVFGMGRVDASGRVGDRAVVAALGWGRDQRCELGVLAGSVLLRAHPDGLYGLSGPGYVVVPARARSRCGINPGDRVLLAGSPRQGVLLVHPPVVVEAALAERHAAVLGVSPDE
ncbi:hypothetical protein J2S53_001425 [Actinopolyspora lacussalsi]|nr:hypothetical protein [Actinopolyspora lacussalsi]